MGYAGQVETGSGAISPIGSTLYGYSNTGASTAAKVVTLDDYDELIVGTTVHVKFTNTNTAANPTLAVGGTAAKPIYMYGTTSPGNTPATSWAANSIVSFTYDGTAWRMNDATGPLQSAVANMNTTLSGAISDETTRATGVEATKETKKLVFTNVSVATSAFESYPSYTEFPYRAAVPLTGVTAAMIPFVAFSAADSASGDFANYVETYAGGVYIFAVAAPSADITIPTIVCFAGS